MENDLELDDLIFDDEEQQDIFIDQDSVENETSLFDRWASWVDIIDN